MTIEAKIEETNLLLRELISVVRPATPGTVPAPTAKPADPAPGVASKPVKPKPAAKPPAEPPQPEKTAADEDIDFDEPEGGAAEEPKKLVKDDARKALVALQVAKGRPEASRAVLKALGLDSIAKVTDADQELIAKIIAGCKKAMPAA